MPMKKSKIDLGAKYQARIISAPFPCSCLHVLFWAGKNSIKSGFFFPPEIFMSIKESHIGDQ